MKKLFFTAVAMIAFSGVSMANTIEEKKEVVLVSCMEVAMNTYREMEIAGLGEEECQTEANAAYGECISN